MAQKANHSSNSTWGLIFAWIWAGIPLVWGVSQTVIKAKVLFR